MVRIFKKSKFYDKDLPDIVVRGLAYDATAHAVSPTTRSSVPCPWA